MRNGGAGHALTLGTAAMLLATPGAQAQVAPPGQRPPTREEIERVPTTDAPPAESRLTVEGGIERSPCPLADPRFANVTVTVRGARFAGLEGIDPALVRPAFEPYLGRQVPIAVVCEIRDVAATLLRRAGYLAAVQVPAQRIDDGVVSFDVLLARLVSVRVRGDIGPSEGLIGRLVGRLADPARPFNQRTAERSLLLARDLPGYDIRLVLRPAGGTPGEVTGDVTVQRLRGALDLNIQNFGSRQVGRWGGLLRAEAFDLLGAGDRLTAGVFQTADFREQTVAQGSYDAWLGASGLTAGLRVAHAWTRPGTGNDDPFRARTLIAGGQIAYPIVRSQAGDVRISGGLELIDQRLRFNEIRLSTDRLRVATLRLSALEIDRASIAGVGRYSAQDPRWSAGVSVELRQGLDVLNAGSYCNLLLSLGCPSGADLQATVIRAEGEAAYRVVPDLELAVAPRGQYAFSRVASYEQFSLGNYTVGRGYEPGTAVGDSGYAVSAELRYGRLRSGPAVQVQPFAFVDAGWAYRRGPSLGIDDPVSLVSVGGGVRASLANRARLDGTVAVPLDRGPFQTKKNAVRFLVSLTTRLLPWR